MKKLNMNTVDRIILWGGMLCLLFVSDVVSPGVLVFLLIGLICYALARVAWMIKIIKEAEGGESL